jgi:endonuclease YncB( thermonuclease family)
MNCRLVLSLRSQLPDTVDRYKRIVATVTCDGINANAEQVQQGMAWSIAGTLADITISMFWSMTADRETWAGGWSRSHCTLGLAKWSVGCFASP